MQKLKKYINSQNIVSFLAVFVFLSLLTIVVYLAPSAAKAQEDAFPGGTDCDETKNPEFSSDRPYQATDCGPKPITFWCGNAVVVSLGTVSCPWNGNPTCTPTITHYEKKVVVDLKDVELPILGNTELTNNGKDGEGSMSEGQMINNYVSWYLNGTTNRAEYEPSNNSQIVNQSGPLRKLLPGVIQDSARKDITETPKKESETTDEDTAATTISNDAHDQIVVCAKQGGSGFLGWIIDIFGIGKSTPTPCYKGGGAASGDVYRLQTWTGTLSVFNALSNTLVSTAVNTYKTIFPFIPAGALESSIGDHWNFRFPPLPWDDGTGKPFAKDIYYQKAYYEWKGQTCMIIPVINKLACFENFLVPNKYADLYSNVPLASPEDKRGAHAVLHAHVSAAKAEILKSDYQIIHHYGLWLAHTQAVADLSSLLQATYRPGPSPGTTPIGSERPRYDVLPNFPDATIPNDVEPAYPCKIIDSRSNPGDDATFDNPDTQMEVDVQYDIGEIQCDEPREECNKDKNPSSPTYGQTICKLVASCKSEVYVTIPTVAKTPFADDIWKNTTAGNESIFRRIYPKTGVDAPVSCISDIPAESKANYLLNERASTGLKLVGVILPDESRISDWNGTDAIEAKLYYPHFGGVLEYFMKGIQTALRPQGFGNTQPQNGQSCTNIVCGELPELPKASGSCNLGGISSRVGDIPQSLKDIISAAAQTYKVPPNLLLAQMFGEGLFNPGRFEWTDQNVKNWATCDKIPTCVETGDDNFMGFNGTVFERTVPKIKADLQKIDPSRKTFSQCNLLDTIYAAAYNLHDSADGGGGLPATCFGIKLSAPVPSSCSWTNEQYESAIKVYESGYTNMCMTVENGCALGGLAAVCPAGDSCETISNRYSSPSHNACVWDVAHGN